MKNLFKAAMPAALLVFAALLLTISCSGKKASDAGKADEKVKIEFFQQKMEEGPQRGYQLVIERFHQEYPQYQVEINTVPDAGVVLTARVASRDVPPLFSDYPTQLQFKEKVRNGFPLDLSNQSFMSRVNPPALEMSRAPDGHDYAMPLSHNFMGVYYNIDIFNKYGVQIPETYAEFLAACKTFKDNGVLPISLSLMSPGRVGHMFQTMNVAWTADGVERFIAVAQGKGNIEGDPVLTRMAEKMLEVVSWGNADAFSLPDTGMWETFANGGAAMCITGSYARGTILLANPNINMGVFPLPNDTVETTVMLTGIDAALCVSASASDKEKEAALAYLEFISRQENAQIFCDTDGAPSNITAVIYADPRLEPVINKMKTGPLHDWLASFVPGNIQNEMYNVTQQFLLDKNIRSYLSQMQKSITTMAAQ